MMKISLVVPVYKSAETLAELHRRMGEVARLHDWDCEVIYVHDASPDHSLTILESLPSEPRYRVVRLKSNQGQSSALLCGMYFAKGEYIGTLDADLQDEPEHLPKFLAAFGPGIEVVFGGRAGQYESGGKLLTSKLFKSLAYLFSGGRVPANAGLFLMIRRPSARELLPYLPHRPYLIGLIAKLGFRCQSIEAFRETNRFGATSYTFIKRVQVALRFFETLRMRPASSFQTLDEWIVENTVSDKI